MTPGGALWDGQNKYVEQSSSNCVLSPTDMQQVRQRQPGRKIGSHCVFKFNKGDFCGKLTKKEFFYTYWDENFTAKTSWCILNRPGK